MNSAAQDIAQMIVDATIATLGTNLFCFMQPDSPDECITVFDTGGYDPDGGTDYYKPTIMIRVRGIEGGYVSAYALTRSIIDELKDKANVVVNATRYVAIWLQGDVMPLGEDESGRPMLSVNFRIHRTPA